MDKVLVVDDGAVNRMLLVRMLEVLGVVADTAADGHEAQRALAADDYAAVLMDVRMPGEDGLAVTAWLRTRESVRRTPVIGVSAGQGPVDRQRCTEAGMDGFLGKPVSLSDLRRALAPYVGLQPEPADQGPVDRDRLASLQEQLGDAGLLRDIVRTYLTELPGRRAALTEAVDAEDRDAVRLVAHSLKSSSAMLRATGLAEICAVLEDSAAVAPQQALVAQVERLDALAPDTAVAMERWVDRS